MLKDFESACVLIIDDTDFSRSVATKILTTYGLSNIIEAKDGVEGLEMTQRYRPDLIISDLVMPNMDGFGYCKAVRELDGFKDTPIIIQTGIAEAEKRAEAFAVGATDVLVKPLNPHEMVARIKMHLEKQALLSNLRVFNNRMEGELASAKRMQQELLPSKSYIRNICRHFPVRIGSYFEASSELSGDFWGAEVISDSEMAIYMVDFTGHGVKAAINTFRLHVLLHNELSPSPDPGEYLTRLNKRLYGLLPSESFATMFYGVVNVKNDEMKYSVAATTSPILFSASSGDMEVIDGSGLPLSVFEDIKYETRTIPFYQGDTLLGYSDALIEFYDANDDMSDDDMLFDFCREYALAERKAGRNLDPSLLTKSVLKYMNDKTNHKSPDDDVTIVSLTRSRDVVV